MSSAISCNDSSGLVSGLIVIVILCTYDSDYDEEPCYAVGNSRVVDVLV